jgi:hypothetical protein
VTGNTLKTCVYVWDNIRIGLKRRSVSVDWAQGRDQLWVLYTVMILQVP